MTGRTAAGQGTSAVDKHRHLPDEILTPREVAQRLQLGMSTVYRALEAGRLPGEKVCGRWRTLHSQLIELVRDNRVPGQRNKTDPMPAPRARAAGRFRGKVVELEARRGS